MRRQSPRRAAEATDPVIRAMRAQIFENDREIVAAINRRLLLAAQLRSYKNARGIPFRDRDREASLLGDLQETNAGPLSPAGLEEIFLALLELTKREIAHGKGDS